MESEELLMQQNGEGFSLKKWLFRMFQLWPWFLLSLAICLSLAFLYLRYTNPVYNSVASIIVEDEKKGAEVMDNSMMKEIGLGGNTKLVENEIEILKSYDLMEAVVNSLQLYTSVQHIGRIRDVDVFANEVPFRIIIQDGETIQDTKKWKVKDTTSGVSFLSGKDKKPVFISYGQTYAADGIQFRLVEDTLFSGARSSEYNVILTSPTEAAIQYGRKLSVDAASKVATVINLEIKDTNKKRGVAALQSLISIYNIQGIEDKNKISDNTVKFLTDRLSEVAGELQGVEGSVERFKSQNRVTDLSSDAQQYLDMAQQVDVQKAQSQTQLNIIDALERDLQTNENNPKLVPSSFGISEPSLNQLISKHNELILQKERQSLASGPKNPLLLDLQEQVKEIRSRLITNVANLKQAYVISLKDISGKDVSLNSRIRNVPLLEKKLVQITRNQNVQEQLYSFLLQKREEAAITRVSNIADSKTILRARSLGKVTPRPKMVWALGILLALILPISIISARDFVNNKIGDVNEIQQHTSLPVLGAIPHIKRLKNPIVINSHSRSAAAEQIRNIRTAISYTGNGKEVKTILITSFQPGEGKSFASLNLAMSYALLDKKTVILEFDLRKPKLIKNMGITAQEGISNILAGKAKLDDLLIEVPDVNGNLYVLPAGNLPPNPAELISGANMNCLVKMLKERFDYIIIDSPPLNVVTDAALLQKHADITVVVLRQNYTSMNVYEKLNSRLNQHPDQRMYILLNDTGKTKRYEENYGYASGYYHDKG
ncbi:MAG: polysaccharide biosynthesis tyrosine autokinase [Chitinophagaceae bacterium]